MSVLIRRNFDTDMHRGKNHMKTQEDGHLQAKKVGDCWKPLSLVFVTRNNWATIANNQSAQGHTVTGGRVGI